MCSSDLDLRVGHLQERRDGREQVVQVVRHAARHAAQQFQFFGQEHLLLEANLIQDEADVLDEARESGAVWRLIA